MNRLNKARKQLWHFVKNMSRRWYFWPLVFLVVLGLVSDAHSTYLFVVNEGIDGERSPIAVSLFHLFAPLKLGDGLTVLLALILYIIILFVAVPLASLATVWASRGNQRTFNTFFFTICCLLLVHVVAAGWNYYHYFSGIMGQ